MGKEEKKDPNKQYLDSGKQLQKELKEILSFQKCLMDFGNGISEIFKNGM